MAYRETWFEKIAWIIVAVAVCFIIFRQFVWPHIVTWFKANMIGIIIFLVILCIVIGLGLYFVIKWEDELDADILQSGKDRLEELKGLIK